MAEDHVKDRLLIDDDDDLVLAVSDGEVDAVLAGASLAFEELSESDAVVLMPLGASDKAITLHLDGPAALECAPVVVTGSDRGW